MFANDKGIANVLAIDTSLTARSSFAVTFKMIELPIIALATFKVGKLLSDSSTSGFTKIA